MKEVGILIKWVLRGGTELDEVIKKPVALMPYTCD